MKKLNLLLISVLFSSLLVGCGMKGPLYRAPEIQTIEKQPTEIKLEEKNETTVKDEDNIS